ncbi:MAG TPA: MlaD family protein [Solirubrobacteraceae bacterium]|jgi:ABC-type transporter Mla subunit MlaD|nr:MlaD family protein [Solirubrobacteraceae bacterium]
MEARSPHWRAVVLPVAFALVCVGLMIGTWVSFGGGVPFAPQGYRFAMTLPQATNVYADTSVRIAGITVGKVESVAREGSEARAVIELQPRYAPLRDGARAIVRAKTLLGEGYIELAPGPISARAIPDDGVLPASHVAPTQQLFDALRIFTPHTRARLRSMFSGLAAAVRGRTGSLGDALAAGAPAVTNFASVAQSLAGQRPSLKALVSDTGTVLSALGTRQGVIESFVRAGDAALSTTARSAQGLRATIAALPAFLTQLRSSSGILSAASADIGAAAGALYAATPSLVPALRAIDTATPVFRTLFQRLPSVLDAGDRGLPALRGVLVAAGPALSIVDETARQLIPFVQLLSLDRNSVVGSLANAAQIQNGVMLAPGVGAIHYAAGALTVWNETVGGWVKRLPTNRSNPYPEPDSEIDIAHGGLRSFDCRNTGNTLYIPPTGTGAPPCLVQGPWEFDGVRAYYPRLQEAPP